MSENPISALKHTKSPTSKAGEPIMATSIAADEITPSENSPINVSDPKVIVVAVDDSKGSEIAFQEALRILGGREGSAIFHIVHVRPDEDEASFLLVNDAEYQANALYGFKEHWDNLEKTRKEIARKLLLRFKAIAEAAHVAFLEVLLQGDPREEICKHVQKAHAELLVVGQRGAGLLTRLFIGSVSLYCLHHADVPVLVVKTPPAAASSTIHAKPSIAPATDANSETTSTDASEAVTHG